MNKYIKKNGELKDKKIVAAIKQAADMYENGELVECADQLREIVEVIDMFDPGC